MNDNRDLTDEIIRLQQQELQHAKAQAKGSCGESSPASAAEDLIADLESTCRNTLETTTECDLSSLVEEDQQIAAQARTQVMHEGPQIRAQAMLQRDACRKTVQDHPVKPAKNRAREERLQKMQGPAETAGALAEKLTYFTYYELLYIEDDASNEEIHSAYVKRVSDIRSRFHLGSITQEWRLTEFIKVLHEAHTILTNKMLREAYDERLKKGQWEGTFKDLVGETPGLREVARLYGGTAAEVSLKGLLLCAGILPQARLASLPEPLDGTDLVQKLTDEGLITFEELAAVMLGKALIDRRLLSVAQFMQAVASMRNQSARFIDAIVKEGWLTMNELQVIDFDLQT
ncbi:MAG: hypothetical protein KGS72_16085 [Cyanobacteria bacterium REEB67]|nr:hypothetical protein [Cyanobacteria bacterium REEB67]